MDSIWSLLGLLFVISIPLLMVLFAIVDAQRSDHDWQRYTVPPMPRRPRVTANPARFFAGAGGIEDTMPPPPRAHGPR
ncbi:hypothetical protein [Streptomyces sp. WAC04114]|uniref:hypothetical protein n=1 Tax=Streptomyces sp. WAC04114 TaxID=2867961 RepID=UPI001C8C666C|nr:hypothetical protein [Streptomyces sp. WAC04114]MBX9365907.1 hypothetical protein [Streptomyces sp. WAC04114]